MKKELMMKKNTFVKGAFITSLGIILTKLLGVLYVIPFHNVIGDEGGALYGYAYTIYLFFISITTSGIPLSISKVVSEYQTLGYDHAKKRVFLIGRQISLFFGLLCCLLVFFLAPVIAKMIFLGDVDATHLSDIVMVIRVVSISFLITPILSVYRGYFTGHKIMSPPSISQVIEQFFRVAIILLGCFLARSIFLGQTTMIVIVALLGASVGAFVSYLFLLIKYKNNKSSFDIDSLEEEPVITNKMILKKIFIYAIPFILIDIFKSLYNYIDMFTVVKSLVQFSFPLNQAETIYSMISTWGQKFNMVVLAISTGVVVSLIPNMTESIIHKNQEDIQNKVNTAFQILFFICIPITLGISFLAEPIWSLFYGTSIYGPKILHYYIYVGLAVSLCTTSIIILQNLKDYPNVFISLFVGVVLKLILNISLVFVFQSLGYPIYYSFITATIIGYGVSFLISIMVLYRKYHIQLKEILISFLKVLLGSIFMILILYIVELFIPISSSVRIYNAFIIAIYGIIGMIVYFIYSYFTKLFQTIIYNKIKE